MDELDVEYIREQIRRYQRLLRANHNVTVRKALEARIKELALKLARSDAPTAASHR